MVFLASCAQQPAPSNVDLEISTTPSGGATFLLKNPSDIPIFVNGFFFKSPDNPDPAYFVSRGTPWRSEQAWRLYRLENGTWKELVVDYNWNHRFSCSADGQLNLNPLALATGVPPPPCYKLTRGIDATKSTEVGKESMEINWHGYYSEIATDTCGNEIYKSMKLKKAEPGTYRVGVCYSFEKCERSSANCTFKEFEIRP